MHIDTKRIATSGLLVAFTVVMMILSSVVESSSLFFIGAASFCIGIAIREWGTWFGLAFLAASTMLNLILAPNKMYCLTFAGMGLYLWLSELLWEKIASAPKLSHRTIKLWIGKTAIFNFLYIPILLFFPSLFIAKKLTGVLKIILFFGGQIIFVVYDVAYRYFQSRIWGSLRVRFVKGEES